MKLEDIRVGAELKGLRANEVVEVVQVRPVGADAVSVHYKGSDGRTEEQMLFRSHEDALEAATTGRSWAFDASGNDFKLGLEAYRISQAALFDPMLAVHTSAVDPLPHQISAVYEAMLPKQPLRYVLADDPGAGKTIMAGLLISELLMRADAQRVLIVAPGSLTEQWHEELVEKFGLEFSLFTRDKQEETSSGNFFQEQDFVIARLDQLSRNDELKDLLKNTSWDLIVVDEAHKLSAKYYGAKVERTARFKLGELLGSITRHFLLMTATPHNGKEEDFQFWLSLLDSDRFYGKFRDGAHRVELDDIMRRMVKEDLLKFDGTKLFPDRRAYTAAYELSDIEADLYAEVTHYVREEMNRADKLDGQKRGTIGFALTQLQRRLASSPEAIYQSLQRRRKRLEARLREEKLIARGELIPSGAETLRDPLADTALPVDPDEIDNADEDLSAEDYERLAEQVVDRASASKTIPELEAEIGSLQALEEKAHQVVQSGQDKKWEELSSILQDRPEMYTSDGARRKLIIFTEHKDTLNYLVEKITGLLGGQEAVVTISGATNRDTRRRAQEEFRFNPDVLVMVATDAAGEGVNLQNANLMVNYDLPWNPNRLEQRFGRIHRIGQEEVCYLWNLLARETREGDVFQKLFDKLEVERKTLGGKVFDILGEAFENQSLKDLLIDAIRSDGGATETISIEERMDRALNTEHLQEILQRTALDEKHMNMADLYAVKEEMDKAEARKLQPYFIRTFFDEAFSELGGELRPREPGRYEIRHVPAVVRQRDRVIGESRTPVLNKYERVCFEKDKVRAGRHAMADFVHPGHPLMHAVLDLTLEKHRAKLKQGAVLVDPTDTGIEPRVLLMIDHTVREVDGDPPRVVSRRLEFVEIDEAGETRYPGWAPHLDLRSIEPDEQALCADLLEAGWLENDLEGMALAHVASSLVPEHFEEVRRRRVEQADKTWTAVRARLVKEINYQSDRAIKLEADVAAGKQPRVQPENCRRQAEELTARLEQRQAELERQKQVVSSTPVVIGGALVIPQGLIEKRRGGEEYSVDAAARSEIERIAMNAVIEHEEALGHTVFDVSDEKCGWDITARPPAREDGTLAEDRHIEVKGRVAGSTTVTVSHNEIATALNQGDKFYLAMVLVDEDGYEGPYYVQRPFTQEPEHGTASINYHLKDFLERAAKAGAPS